MSDEFTIGEAEIDKLKQHLLDDIDAFAAFYKKREGHALKNRKKKYRPVWTEYINGSKKAEGYDEKAPSGKIWPGVFRLWLSELNPPEPVVWKYEQYRIDCMLRTGQKNRKTGEYKILVAFQQENDPSEVILHTREMYDYNMPEKVVLIWSDDTRKDIKELAEEARSIPGLVAAQGVKNAGKIHVLVANRKIRDFWVEKRTDLPTEQFEYVFIPSDLD